MSAPPRIGVALGGGGAKGLAHIPILEVLDDHGIRPCMLAGTSIGAVIGVIYASGIPAREIRSEIERWVTLPRSLRDVRRHRRMLGVLNLVRLDISRSNILSVEKMLTQLERFIGRTQFEELEIPMRVVAADFWKREEIVLDSGPIVPAVAASFALPGIFEPVVRDGRVLVDGGSVNPLPYDLLLDHCDEVIAVDVIGHRRPKRKLKPSYPEMVFNIFQIAERTIVNEKLKNRPPSIYLEPEITGIRVLEFHKAHRIFEQAGPACARLKRELRERGIG